ncbi:3-isopropylmalate dehydratase small subunit [Qipengyuania sp. DGS5-3]|uniref:3-isopropylmalate dehydratase small subunit n=1 Tax=Qipengyuania sp. DGS5-3 TaxID=3349632 RepID=UPI0036D2A1CE
MSAFPQPLIGIAAPLDAGELRDNVDTDAIIPSREMRSTGRDGLADGLFAPWRYSDADARIEDPDFVLNQAKYRETKILLSGANFGCGSSREHAVWALAEYGIQAIIAESFAPIFYGNCIRNFILPIALDRAAAESMAGCDIEIDLAAQTLTCSGDTHRFEIDTEAKQMLAEGLDAIDLTLTQEGAIKDWTASDQTARPWVYLEHTS